jgi:hypothetical protein
MMRHIDCREIPVSLSYLLRFLITHPRDSK